MNNSRIDRIVKRDVVVVGSGVAGMTAALGLAPLSVAVVTKKALGEGSSSRLAQGGVAVALGQDDSPFLHSADTLEVGYGLSDRETVELVTSEGPELIRELIALGARFDRQEDGQILLGREAAHSRRRIVHANGDSTGAELVRTLEAAVRHSPRVLLEEGCFAVDLVVEGGRVRGLIAQRGSGEWILFQSGAVVLATGGIGSLYAYSTNPAEATGDGLAMAARAGATLSDLEFVQFHPTALACETSPLPLLTEALRGEGAVLIDSDGDRFMVSEHPLAELAPRDVVSRAIWRKRRSGKEVYLDARQAVGSRFPQRFPTVFEFCQQHGIDPRQEPIPATPAAHYHIGGIVTDLSGRASLPGLWACGEVASTGLHGANRLASNSLLEAMVFGQRVAEEIHRDWQPRSLLGRTPEVRPVAAVPEERTDLVAAIRNLMWEQVGLVRNADSLTSAILELGRIEREGSLPLQIRNMLTVGRLVAQSALDREESRGVHYRSDFPESRIEWERRIFITDNRPSVREVMAMAK